MSRAHCTVGRKLCEEMLSLGPSIASEQKPFWVRIKTKLFRGLAGSG